MDSTAVEGRGVSFFIELNGLPSCLYIIGRSMDIELF